MSYRIAFAGSSKGGSGKTTTATNVAVWLVRLGYRVLLVGADASGNAETTFGASQIDPGASHLATLITQGGEVRPLPIDVPAGTPPARRFTRVKRKVELAKGSLALLPSGAGIDGPDVMVACGAQESRVHELLSPVDPMYDFVLIDAAGGTGPLELAARAAADGIVFVGRAAAFDLNAVITAVREIADFRNARGQALEQLGVLFTRTDPRSSAMRDYAANYQDPTQFSPPLHVFSRPIRPQASVDDDPGDGMPTSIAAPDSRAAVDYRHFTDELVARIADFTRVNQDGVGEGPRK